MNPEKKKTYDNTSTSYLSLKAELLRKTQDIQRTTSTASSSSVILENLQSTSSSLRIKAKPDSDIEVVSASKKKKKIESTPPPAPTPTTTISKEDEIAYAKSRAILEAKSKLYEEIMSNSEMRALAEEDSDDDNKSFLVDFEKKIYDTNQTDTTHANMIEYTDSFGRTRFVTPEEYEQLKASDKRNSSERSQSHRTESEIDRVERLHREQMRSKWESEMEALRNKTEVHYQDVLFDEKREHGVGYYNFSTDDKQRAEQMATLNELRASTINEQEKFSVEQDKRQSAVNERLNKIRLRKAKEMGIDLSGKTSNNPPPISILVEESLVKADVKEPSNDSTTKHEDVSIPVLKETPNLSKPLETSEPIPEQTRQPKPLPQTQSNKDSPFAYPFPVMRTGANPSSSIANKP